MKKKYILQIFFHKKQENVIFNILILKIIRIRMI